MKKIVKMLLCLIVFITPFSVYSNDKNEVKVYIFIKDDDNISNQTVEYFNKLKEKHLDSFNVETIIVWDATWKENRFNRNLLNKVVAHFDDEVLGAPYIVVGDRFSFDEYSEELFDEYEKAILSEVDNDNYIDIVSQSINFVKHNNKINTIWATFILVSIPSMLMIIKLLAKNKNK